MRIKIWNCYGILLLESEVISKSELLEKWGYDYDEC